MKNNIKKGATLPEVLITLVIVGVIGVLVLPVLIASVMDKVNQRQIQVKQLKISHGLEEMAIQGGFLKSYDSTLAFAEEFSKYIKIIQICDSNHLRNCWTYDSIIVNDKGKLREVASQKDGKKAFHMPDGDWGETVGMVFGNGVQMLLSYRKDCLLEDDTRFKTDKETGLTDAAQCVAGVWELNGPKGQNKYGKDVIPYNAQGFGGANCIMEEGSLCMTTPPKTPTPLQLSDYCTKVGNNWVVNEESQKLGIQNCCTNANCKSRGDYWAGAVKECGGIDNLPTEQQLTDLASYLYNTTVSPTGTTYGTLDMSKLPESFAGLSSSWNDIWSNREYNNVNSYRRYFLKTYTGQGYSNATYHRGNPNIKFFCIDKE